ncbi:hypothetical protein HPP92_023471 [Vanilla planifolia]|uniref:Lecithin-cholesterol acyltransferase-like 1 n=1 Tax=Vanilla planifolia TaxID=51239 RepID=A0A835PN01_VANPL|nr:hypothetical protein HPP92_023471 [Vanilla planifolia]
MRLKKKSSALAVVLLVAMALHLQSIVCSIRENIQLDPVVLIPGAGGNQLEARLTSDFRTSSIICGLSALTKRGDWFRLWFDPTVLVPPLTRCFAERMKLSYDPAVDDFRNAHGVDTRVPRFGSTGSLLYLDPNLKHITGYMASLVSALEQLGYRDGYNLFGAPYDFRYGLAAHGHPSSVGTQYLRDLRDLIELAAAANGGRPVVLICHSLGGLFALHLLDRSSHSWRQQFVKHLVSLSTPWAGTVQEMLCFASGYSLGIPIVDPLTVREEQRSSESNLWLLPAHRVFGEMPLVFANNKSYSARDIPDFLNDIGFEEGVLPYKTRIHPLVATAPEPEGVSVTCIVGLGIDTPETLFYLRKGFEVQPDVLYGDGDGTVNVASLLALEKDWTEAARKHLKVIKLYGISHNSILKDKAAIQKIIDVLGDIQKTPSLNTVLAPPLP